MDRFYEKYNLPVLTLNRIENPHSFNSIKLIELVILSLPTKKTKDQMISLVKSKH
jgi:hypothetical protein